MALSRCPYSRENACGVKRPFDRVPEPGAPLRGPGEGLQEGLAAPDLPGQHPAGLHQDLQDGPLADGRRRPQMGGVDPAHPGRTVATRAPTGPGPPDPSASASSAPASGPAGARTSSVGSTPARTGRRSAQRAARAPWRREAAAHQTRSSAAAATSSSSSPPPRPGTRQLEDPVLEPAVGPDQLGQLVDAPPRRGGARRSLSHPPTPRGPRSGSGW